jgi:predicted nucleotidyltransferase
MKEHLIQELFATYPSIKLAYLFGSRARGEATLNSDYDFALYVDELDLKGRLELRLELQSKLCDLLKTEAVDLIILNDIDSIEFSFQVIHEGKLIHEVEPYKVQVEPRIMNLYFDFRESLRRNGLTKA